MSTGKQNSAIRSFFNDLLANSISNSLRHEEGKNVSLGSSLYFRKDNDKPLVRNAEIGRSNSPEHPIPSYRLSQTVPNFSHKPAFKRSLSFLDLCGNELGSYQFTPNESKQISIAACTFKITFVNNHYFIQEIQDSCKLFICLTRSKINPVNFYYIGRTIVIFKSKKGKLIAKYKSERDESVTLKLEGNIGFTQAGWCVSNVKPEDILVGTIAKLDTIIPSWEFRSIDEEPRIYKMLHSKLTSRKGDSAPLEVKNGMAFGFEGEYMKAIIK